MEKKKDSDWVQIQTLEPENSMTIEQAARLETEIFPDPWSCHEIKKTVLHKQTICAAAKEGDALVGYLLCYYVLDECEIARIAVDEKIRRRGIGQMLLSYLEDECKEKGVSKILLDVRRSNRTAICFYEKNGFQTDGVRKGYYSGKTTEDAILMSRMI